MLSPSPAVTATRPGLRSLVVSRPVGALVVGPLLLGLPLVLLAGLQLVAGYWQRTAIPGGALGLGLLGLAWCGATRSNQSMLLTGTREALRLEPVGRSIVRGVPAETIPLASVRAYKYWLRVLRYGVFAQYHLRLELTDGRVLHLADQPGLPPDVLKGTVRLDAVARKLPRWVKPGTRQQKLFYATQLARYLLWVGWAAIAIALALLALGYSAGSLLLFPAAGYWASYYLGRGTAELTP